MTTQNRRLWAVLFVCLAVGALILVAAALPILEFRPGQSFAIEPTAEAKAPLLQRPWPDLDAMPYRIILGLILMAGTVATIVGAIVSPEMRKKLLRLLPVLLILVLLLLRRLEPSAVPLEPPPAALPAAAQSPGPQAPLAVFDASPPSWLLWATGCPVKPKRTCPRIRFMTKATPTSAMAPESRWACRKRTKSRMAPMVQNRLLCARKPMRRPATSDKRRGACMEPGPLTL